MPAGHLADVENHVQHADAKQYRRIDDQEINRIGSDLGQIVKALVGAKPDIVHDELRVVLGRHE